MSAENNMWQNLRAVDTIASKFYRDLPYHNYPHGLLVGHHVELIVEEARQNGVELDGHLLQLASRWHDAGEYNTEHGFPTTEAYAAALASQAMPKLGMPENQVTELGAIIESSHPTAKCDTPNKRAFRQADLRAGGILAGTKVFLGGTKNLYLESRLLRGAPGNLPRKPQLIKHLVSFGEKSYGILDGMIEDDLSVGEYQRDDEGNSIFNQAASRQIRMLLPPTMERILHAHFDEIMSFEPVPVPS